MDEGENSMKNLPSMGKFTAIGMRTPVVEGNALVINTCSQNDTCLIGNRTQWTWSNPTNRLVSVVHPEDETVTAVSVEALWQGTKIFRPGELPDILTLEGDWRRAKAKRPIGAWAGEGVALHRSAASARRAIYIPAFIRQKYEILFTHAGAEKLVRDAAKHDGPVYLRDWDTGRGVERNAPMSHAWVLAEILNTGNVPQGYLDDELKMKAEAIHYLTQR
jgi:hypothetical protein